MSGPKPRVVICKHAGRPHYAWGLCNPCYQRASRTPERRARNIAAARAWREKYKQAPYMRAPIDGRCFGLEPDRAQACADILDSLGKVYAPDFDAECEKPDYRVVA